MAFAIVITSCNAPRYVYSPSATNTAMFSGAGEGNVSAQVSSSATVKGAGVNLAAAYSPVNHVGIGAQFYSTNDKNQGADGLIGGTPRVIALTYKRSMAQGQVFFYTPFGENQNFFGEIGLGYGSGKYRMNDTQTDTVTDTRTVYFHDAKARHATAHATVYGVFGKEAPSRVGLSVRLNNVKFHNINTSYSPSLLREYFLDSLTYQSVSFLAPTISFAIGIKSIPGFEITGQAGLSAKLNGPAFENRNSHFSIGFGYRLGKQKNETKK